MDTLQDTPVYILGAGFSKAINDSMPLMNELGEAVAAKFREKTGREVGYQHGQSFEAWLSLASVDMPFMKSYENLQRAADAEFLVSLIAEELDKVIGDGDSFKLPLWLCQLIDVWNVEHAKVITFNYDILLEQAINRVRPLIVESNQVTAMCADQLVFPRPNAERDGSAIGFDTEAPFLESMQILKLHGSLNWYWAADDALGSSLRRVPVRNLGVTEDHSVQGLDRFLIPPVSEKSKYYHPYLTRSLWRDAYDAIRNASSITLMGYSLPKTDSVTVDLLSAVDPTNASLNIVDLNPTKGNKDSLSKRARRATGINRSKTREYGGRKCFEHFVNERVKRLASNLPLKELLSGNSYSGVLLMAHDAQLSAYPRFKTLKIQDSKLVPGDYVDPGNISAISPGDSIYDGNSEERYYESDELLDVERADRILQQKGRIVITRPDSVGKRVHKYSAIGAQAVPVGNPRDIALQVTQIG